MITDKVKNIPSKYYLDTSTKFTTKFLNTATNEWSMMYWDQTKSYLGHYSLKDKLWDVGRSGSSMKCASWLQRSSVGANICSKVYLPPEFISQINIFYDINNMGNRTSGGRYINLNMKCHGCYLLTYCYSQNPS